MKGIKQKLTKKRIALSLLAGICLYAGIYAYATNSDAYLSAKQELLSSKQFSSEVGEIRDVTLPLFGLYKSHHEGIGADSTGYALFKVKVIGTQRTMTLSIRTKKEGGAWKIEKVNDRKFLSLGLVK